jgi:hypothetical protein
LFELLVGHVQIREQLVVRRFQIMAITAIELNRKLAGIKSDTFPIRDKNRRMRSQAAPDLGEDLPQAL